MSQRDDNHLIGKILGQFEILEEIGRGGMATVYRARQLSMNRLVAIKVLPRHLLHDPSFYERFEREVEVITQLEHPHILPIYDYGQADGMPYIAMRYLGGGSLEQRIRRGIPGLDEVEKPLRQIAQALDHAHRQGIIHRDLKPGNIMLDEHGNAYLSDFGIARVLGSNLTGSMIVGTPAYMSPEQANGVPIDGRSDIYAFGVVIFELLTGQEPYQAETPMAILLKHINEPMPPIADYRDDIPDEIEDVIIKATAKDPDDRYASAVEMVDAFSAAIHGHATEIGSATKPVSESRRESRRPLTTQHTAATAPVSKTSEPAIAPPITSTGIGTETGQFQQRGNFFGLLIVAAVIIIVGGVIAAILLTNTNASATVAAVPTAFPRASTIENAAYSISIPDEWIPRTLFQDLTSDFRDHNVLLHRWTEGSQAFVSLGIVDASVNTPERLTEAATRYEVRHYSSENLTLIDESIAEDGTIRRSYRFEGGEENPSGQLDVFYMSREDMLVVLDMFTADETGNTFVPTLQLILDSLRVKASI